MKVFITWSGERSREVAEIFNEYIPTIIQGCETFFSEDMDKGSVWFPRLGEELEECDIGLICLTPENLSEDWILFETGALLSLEEDESKVCPFLYDLDTDTLEDPLYQFNAIHNEKEDIKRFFRTIKDNMDDPLEDDVFDRTFERFWDNIREGLEDISGPPEDYEYEEKNDSEKIDEILNKLKRIDKRTTGTNLDKTAQNIEHHHRINLQLEEGVKKTEIIQDLRRDLSNHYDTIIKAFEKGDQRVVYKIPKNVDTQILSSIREKLSKNSDIKITSIFFA